MIPPLFDDHTVPATVAIVSANTKVATNVLRVLRVSALPMGAAVVAPSLDATRELATNSFVQLTVAENDAKLMVATNQLLADRVCAQLMVADGVARLMVAINRLNRRQSFA